MVWPIVAAGVGAALGGTAAGMGAASTQGFASNVRRRVRGGIRSAEAEAESLTKEVMYSPEYLAYQDFIRGLYGIEAPAGTAATQLLAVSQTPSEAAGDLLGRADVLASDIAQIIRGEEPGGVYSKFFLREIGRQDPTVKSYEDAAAKIREDPERYIYEQLTAFRGLAPLVEDRLQSKGLSLRDLEDNSTFQDVVGTALAGKYKEEVAELGLGQVGGTKDSISPILENYVQGLRQAQIARGTYYGGAAEADEAARVGAMESMYQLQALPYLQNLAQFPVTFEQQLFPGLAQKEVYLTTGGLASYGQPAGAAAPGASPGAAAFSGALGGASLGFSLGSALSVPATSAGGSALQFQSALDRSYGVGSGFIPYGY